MRGKVISFEPAGLNNRIDPVDMLPVELVVAENVDLRKSRSARRRKGGAQVLAGDFHSLWGNGQEMFAGKLTAGVSTLERINSDLTSTTLATFSVNAPLAFEQVNATTVVTNGVGIGFIENGVYVAPVAPTATHMRATVAGEHLTLQNGRLLIGRQSSIYYTIAYNLEAMDRRFCQIPFPGVLSMMVALKTGVWVSYADKVVFLQGAGPEEYQYVPKGNLQVIRGTSKRTDARLFLKDGQGEAVIFMTNEGPHLGTEQGQLVPLTAENISAGVGLFGASMVREADGYTHFVAGVQEPDAALNKYSAKSIIVNAWGTGATLPRLTSQT